MTIRVKICGIRSFEEAEAAIKYGADFLGFNFVKSSKRYVEPKTAAEIIGKINKSGVKIAGVFKYEEIEKINYIYRFLKLDFTQIHGNYETEKLNIEKDRIIKVFNTGPKFDEKKKSADMKKTEAKYYLLDRKIQGEGERVDLIKAGYLALKFPLILAGGLTPENVKDAVIRVKPFAVDVASGVETNGKKDFSKIEKFIKEAKGL